MNKYLIILLFLISAFPANGQEDSLALKEADMMLNVADTISQIIYRQLYFMG